jgi:hypothetical protein
MSSSGWIGVDLDGTLAQYDHWRGIEHIGEPVPAMLERVKGWLAEGKDVRIFTARVAYPVSPEVIAQVDARSGGSGDAIDYIVAWCKKHLGRAIPVTNAKDFEMVELWDDRCVQVVPNTGWSITEHLSMRYGSPDAGE